MIGACAPAPQRQGHARHDLRGPRLLLGPTKSFGVISRGKMEGGRSLPFPARGCPHVALGLCILITVCERAGELARTTDMPNRAAAPVGDAPCCAKSIDDEARVEVPVSDWCRVSGVAGGCMVHSQRKVWTYLRSSKLPPSLN